GKGADGPRRVRRPRRGGTRHRPGRFVQPVAGRAVVGGRLHARRGRSAHRDSAPARRHPRPRHLFVGLDRARVDWDGECHPWRCPQEARGPACSARRSAGDARDLRNRADGRNDDLIQACDEVRVAGRSDAATGSQPIGGPWVGLFVPPTAPPLAVGIGVTASFIVAETVLVYLLEKIFPAMPFGVVFLLGVLVVSAGWGSGLAVSTTVASALVYAFVHLDADGSIFPITVQDWVAIIIFVPIALLANLLGGTPRLRAAEANRRRMEAEDSRDELRVLAGQQAALRRIATLVARAVVPSEVFTAVADELACCLGVDHSALVRYQSDGTAIVLASHDDHGP